MKSKVRDQVEIGISSLYRPLLTWKTLTRTHTKYTLHSFRERTLSLYPQMHTVRWRCTGIFSTKKWKKQCVDTLTGTPVQYNAIYCNHLATHIASVKMIFWDCVRKIIIHLVVACCVVVFGLCFMYSVILLVFLLLCPPLILLLCSSCSLSPLGMRPTEHKIH